MSSDAKLFRCKCYEPLFWNIYKSYEYRNVLDEWKTHRAGPAPVSEHKKFINLGGGSTSGKSVHTSHELAFWIPEMNDDKALILVYSSAHKARTAKLVANVIRKHGHKVKEGKEEDGTRYIRFANNEILVMSMDTNSKDKQDEKWKTQTDDEPVYKFLWLEEFTALISSFESFGDFNSAISRMYRQVKEDGIIIFTYNPPEDKFHKVWEWRNRVAVDERYMHMHTTIYDLPERWQDSDTLEEAERLRESNPEEWNQIYMGNPTSNKNVAFNMSETIRIPGNVRREDYYKFHIQSDEGTANATTFALMGLTWTGEVHYLTNYYHSNNETGHFKSSSMYAQNFDEWFKQLGLDYDVDITSNFTDGKDFMYLLKNLGYHKTRSMSGKNERVDDVKKDRVESYRLLNMLVNNDKFKICDRPENKRLFTQMSNAKKEFTASGKSMVSKKAEATKNYEKHTHALDTVLYTMLVFRRDLIKGGTK